jgi:hypothetical protein
MDGCFALLAIKNINKNDRYPSPDRNGYPGTCVGELVGHGVGGRWREEYEWIAGKATNKGLKKEGGSLKFI